MNPPDQPPPVRRLVASELPLVSVVCLKVQGKPIAAAGFQVDLQRNTPVRWRPFRLYSALFRRVEIRTGRAFGVVAPASAPRTGGPPRAGLRRAPPAPGGSPEAGFPALQHDLREYSVRPGTSRDTSFGVRDWRSGAPPARPPAARPCGSRRRARPSAAPRGARPPPRRTAPASPSRRTERASRPVRVEAAERSTAEGQPADYRNRSAERTCRFGPASEDCRFPGSGLGWITSAGKRCPSFHH